MGWSPIRAVKKAVSNTAGAVGDVASGAVDVAGDVVGGAVDVVEDVVTGAGDVVQDVVVDPVVDLGSTIDDVILAPVIDPIVKAGEQFEDAVREGIDEVDKLVQDPYVQLATQIFFPQYAPFLDAYATVDSGETLSASQIASLAAAGYEVDAAKQLPSDVKKALNTTVKLAEGDDPLKVLVSAYGEDFLESSGIKSAGELGIQEAIGSDAYNLIKDNIDVARVGYDVLVEGKDPSEAIANRYGDEIVGLLGSNNPNVNALGYAGLATAVQLDKGKDSDEALLTGAKEYYERGGQLPNFNEIANLAGVSEFNVGIPDLDISIPEFQSLGFSLPEISNLGVDVSKLSIPTLFEGGFTIPEIQGLGLDVSIPDLESLGFTVPEIANLGFDISSLGLDRLYSEGFTIPEIQGLGLDISIPDLENLGFNIPQISDLGFDVSSLGLEGLELRGLTLPEIRDFGVDISGLQFPDLQARGFGLGDIGDLGFDIASMDFSGYTPGDLGDYSLPELKEMGVNLGDLDLNLELGGLGVALMGAEQQRQQLEEEEDLLEGMAQFQPEFSELEGPSFAREVLGRRFT